VNAALGNCTRTLKTEFREFTFIFSRRVVPQQYLTSSENSRNIKTEDEAHRKIKGKLQSTENYGKAYCKKSGNTYNQSFSLLMLEY
jgi:hypothetical protein